MSGDLMADVHGVGEDRRDRRGDHLAADDGGSGGRRSTGSRPRSRRRLALAGATTLAATAAVTAVVVSRGGDGGGGEAPAAATTTVPVEVRDLVTSDDFEGELGYGATDPVAARRAGVVTEVTPVGTAVGLGQVLFDLDLQPTVLLHGEIPAFRDLSVDADDGADITQLEQALVDLGHGAGVTVDAEFTDATADAVEAWEEALGRSDPDGVVALGDVVFAPADLRIAEVTAERGTQVQSGGEVVQVTATTKVVTLELGVDDVADVEGGTPVTVTLPDDTEATGMIADVGTEPTDDDTEGEDPNAPTEETYPVTVTLDDPAAADAFDSGAVEVTIERSRTEGATAVPVTALLALSEGGYAVEVAGGGGLVPVEVGTIAEDWVEVTGEGIEAGVDVVVPA